MLLSFSLCALALAPALGAQTEAVLGRENSEFARLLFQGGYPDLAEELCRVITANGADAGADD